MTSSGGCKHLHATLKPNSHLQPLNKHSTPGTADSKRGNHVAGWHTSA